MFQSKEELEKTYKELDKFFIENFKMTTREFIAYEGTFTLNSRLKVIIRLSPRDSPEVEAHFLIEKGSKVKLADNIRYFDFEFYHLGATNEFCLEIVDAQLIHIGEECKEIVVRLKDFAKAIQ